MLQYFSAKTSSRIKRSTL